MTRRKGNCLPAVENPQRGHEDCNWDVPRGKAGAKCFEGGAGGGHCCLYGQGGAVDSGASSPSYNLVGKLVFLNQQMKIAYIFTLHYTLVLNYASIVEWQH